MFLIRLLQKEVNYFKDTAILNKMQGEAQGVGFFTEP